MAQVDEAAVFASKHTQLVSAGSLLRIQSSQLRNAVSSHRLPNPVSFAALDGFITTAEKVLGPNTEHRLFMGSIEGLPVVSARLRAVSEPSVHGGKKKRARDDAHERAEAACAKLRKHGDKAHIARAQDTIERLLRTVKGPAGEEVFESCGVSLAATATHNASVSSPLVAKARPKVIVAARLAAGVALPLAVMKKALGECFGDGMITTNPETLGPEYQLPLSAAGKAVEASGQRSLLLFAAVPEPEAVAAVATAPSAAQ